MDRTPTTLLALVDEGLPKNTTGVAFATHRGGTWLKTSVDEFQRRVRHVALGLHDLGIGPGDTVAIHAENSTEWVILDNALLSIGAVNVPIYTTQPGDQIKYILEDAEARFYAVSTPELYAGFAPHASSLPGLSVISLLGADLGAGDILTLDYIAQRGLARDASAGDLFRDLRAKVSPGDLATLIYTSGTTGQPKGVMLTHDNLASNALGVQGGLLFDPEAERGKTILSYLPLSHVFERMLMYLYMNIGFPVYFVDGIDTILDDLQTVKPVHFTTVPRLLEKVYGGIRTKIESGTGIKAKLGAWALGIAETYETGQPKSLQHKLADRLVFSKLRDLFGGRVKAITSGGAALSSGIMNFMNAIGIQTAQGYGLTETSPVITMYVPGQLRAGTVGKPIPHVEVKIAEDGEILARGPNIMKGYYNKPGKTAEVMEPGGWFHTGDIGEFDADGFLKITDRKKQLLKLSTGKYVAPTPLESALVSHPLVEQVVVIGNEHKFCAALIVPNEDAVRRAVDKDGAMITEDELYTHPDVQARFQAAIDKANETRPHWEQIKRFTLLRRPFTIETGELTPTMKLKRRVIQENYAEQIDALYA